MEKSESGSYELDYIRKHSSGTSGSIESYVFATSSMEYTEPYFKALLELVEKKRN